MEKSAQGAENEMKRRIIQTGTGIFSLSLSSTYEQFIAYIPLDRAGFFLQKIRQKKQASRRKTATHGRRMRERYSFRRVVGLRSKGQPKNV